MSCLPPGRVGKGSPLLYFQLNPSSVAFSLRKAAQIGLGLHPGAQIPPPAPPRPLFHLASHHPCTTGSLCQQSCCPAEPFPDTPSAMEKLISAQNSSKGFKSDDHRFFSWRDVGGFQNQEQARCDPCFPGACVQAHTSLQGT